MHLVRRMISLLHLWDEFLVGPCVRDVIFIFLVMVLAVAEPTFGENLPLERRIDLVELLKDVCELLVIVLKYDIQELSLNSRFQLLEVF